MSIAPQNAIAITENATVTRYTADYSHVETYEEMGAIGATLKDIDNSSPYWLFYWTLAMVDKGFMTKEDVYGEFTNKDSKTIDNWFALEKCQHRLPKRDDDIPHKDWSFSHFVATAPLDDQEYIKEKQWILDQEEAHGRIASCKKYGMHRAGKDPYGELPKRLTGDRDALHAALEAGKTYKLLYSLTEESA